MNPNPVNETAYFVFRHVIPDAYQLLPGRMNTPESTAMLMAIGLQESRFIHRNQVPVAHAHGFWQFEKGGGIKAVLTHDSTRSLIIPVLETLRYPIDTVACYAAVSHNDVLAVVFARLLLWSLPFALPKQGQDMKGWSQYIEAWRPGKPHPQTWPDNFRAGWALVLQG